jgi:hypothetical protein
LIRSGVFLLTKKDKKAQPFGWAFLLRAFDCFSSLSGSE